MMIINELFIFNDLYFMWVGMYWCDVVWLWLC